MRIITLLFFVSVTRIATAQLPVDSISEAEISHTLNYLASDSLKGRGDDSPGLYDAARFIEGAFKQMGLTNVLPSYLQPFTTKNVASTEKIKDIAVHFDPQKVLLNVIGMIPGKTLSKEIILFSAHYDHVGVQEPIKKDSIYNGANDNASGTAALLALASYFSKRGDNERTLLFCAFAGEELGLFGSSYFVQAFNTNTIKAVVNIEMIGRSTGIGKNSVFITGADQSSFAAIFKKNVTGKIRVRNEPDEERQLFMRSDNYPFVLKGIAAHSIMSSDDSDPCYHKSCDEIRRIDITNLTAIIRGIASGCRTLIQGTDTPVTRY
jgi:Zn-dependent M28 family amino/carboxypeptidase